jgi:hypothetical protein
MFANKGGASPRTPQTPPTSFFTRQLTARVAEVRLQSPKSLRCPTPALTTCHPCACLQLLRENEGQRIDVDMALDMLRENYPCVVCGWLESKPDDAAGRLAVCFINLLFFFTPTGSTAGRSKDRSAARWSAR